MESKEYINKLELSKRINFNISAAVLGIAFLVMISGYIINFIYSYRDTFSTDKMNQAWKTTSIALIISGTLAIILILIYILLFRSITNNYIQALKEKDNEQTK